MTKVVVEAGICGFTTTVEVSKLARRKVKVVITSPCEKITKLGGSLTEIDQWEIFKKHVDCDIYQSAARCQLHVTCPVPVAVLKAIEVETGLALPHDFSIRFENTEHE